MIEKDDLRKIREEREILDTWRKVSRHIVADLLEMCVVCDAVRDKDHLVRCEGCEDAYVCREGPCARLHEFQSHPAISRWRS